MPATLVVGGLPVTVYGLDHLTRPQPGQTATKPVAVAFLLHGRGQRSDDKLMVRFADRLVQYSHDQATTVKDLVVVTFDQRNHGHRLVAKDRQLGWLEGGKRRHQERLDAGLEPHDLDNPSHAADMMAMQVGTARDVSFLVDFLPAALFPNDERTVADWYCAGISLGGHATWLALAHDPRISLGVPIIGSPSTHILLSHRASNLPPPAGPLPLAPPYFPASLVALFAREDPANVELERWDGRSVLVLSGEDDQLVNYVHGGTEAFVARLENEAKRCKVEAWVQPKTGHACTPEMIERTCEFICREGLAAPVAASARGGIEAAQGAPAAAATAARGKM
ncbi:uncharacterized protein RHOBADRAFT_55354 [Rhodotorula graminis WP1]|uniref:Peptidase S9 prolyl oligopeptidase catalytic domain-containing protein n=1 Tax=Rhodotorula graminis (strain WP1) TaxID=578459 RepID=A0A0P9H046_RHOGW|nr:uncharacterized protein RHOBADRAFT_55354 [Rhodotorula graminis WP1]KPV73132.1 hypothetical protein RHOBADRAFT_55354 [Rhodotorula graminis WP1]